MKFQIKSLSGEDIEWKPKSNKASNLSNLQKRASVLLYKLYPVHTILEEVSIPIKRGETLFADFFLPSELLIVEVQGKQHYIRNKFHYRRKSDFYKAKAKDNCKRLWASINDFILIELPYNETDDEWEQRLA